MPFADQVSVKTRIRDALAQVVVLTAGSTGAGLRAARPLVLRLRHPDTALSLLRRFFAILPRLVEIDSAHSRVGFYMSRSV